LEMKNVRAAGLTLTGGKLSILSDGTSTGVSRVNSLSVAGGTQLDLNNNSLIVDYAGSTPLASVRQYLLNGRGGTVGTNTATWNDTGGIMSSAIIAHITASNNRFDQAIGYAENSSLGAAQQFNNSTHLFNGQSVDQSSILIRYTRGADTNLDGVVSGADADVVGANFNLTDNTKQWFTGDFDYDGICSGSDADILGATYDVNASPLSSEQLTAQFGSAFAEAFEGGQARAAASAVPEPGSLALLGLGGLGLLKRRSRRR
jgi:hypothetical protein